ncbi:MAG TPA: DUF72 domain-containing protein [Rhodocyclaceae bacterium]|nr:DUF72 domain-containing protein [Rhodocyclaceae bacterium]
MTGKKAAAGQIRVGIAGWQYAPWRGTFYPEGLVQRRELEYASRALPCIEINSTFYGPQTPKTFASWFAQTPDDFVFSLKAPKRITHEKRLHDVEESITRFLTSGLVELQHKLGPILWQFPPNLQFNPGLFEAFLALLPHKTEAADAAPRKLRHAVEIRHDSFVDPAFIAMLRHHNVALVVADTARRWPEFEDVCSDFMYLRLHGADEQYISGYPEAALEHWAERIRTWSLGKEPADARRISGTAAAKRASRDVFCYFDNTMKEAAPLNATRVLEKLGIAPDVAFKQDFAPPAKKKSS